MTYPAWFAFHRDPAIRRCPSAGAIYAALVGLENIFFQPREVKSWVLAEALCMERETVAKSLRLLVGRGYLVEHARASRSAPRRFTVALVQPEERDATTAYPPSRPAA